MKKIIIYLLAFGLVWQFSFVQVQKVFAMEKGGDLNTENSGGELGGTNDINSSTEAISGNAAQTQSDSQINTPNLPEVKSVESSPSLPIVKDVKPAAIQEERPKNSVSNRPQVKPAAVINQVIWTGSILINNDNQYTNSQAITLTIFGSRNGIAPDEMKFSDDDTNWLDWEPYVITKNWVLESGPDGNRNVYVQFRTFTDPGYSYSSHYSDLIILDTMEPQIESVILNPNSDLLGIGDQVEIIITEENDETGLIASGTFNSKNVVWFDKNDGTYSAIYIVSGDDPSANDVEITDATLTDQAGNVSAIASSSGDDINIDSQKPTISNITLSKDYVKGDGSVEVVLTCQVEDDSSGAGIVRVDLSEFGFGYVFMNKISASNYMIKFNPVADSGYYPLKITAFDVAGNITTGSIALSVDSTPPATPKNIQKIIGVGFVFLRWDAVLDADHYEIWRTGSDFKLIGVTDSNYFKDETATAGKNYTYQIIAIDEIGNRSKPAQVSVTTSLIIIAPEITTSSTTQITSPQIASATVEKESVKEKTPQKDTEEVKGGEEKNEEGTPINWPLIIGIVLASLVVLFWIYYWYASWKESKKSSKSATREKKK